jgi:hypothetical protein
MVRVLSSNAVNRGFEPRSDQTKNYKGGFILRVRQRCDEQYNCCDGEAILFRNHSFLVESLLSFLVRVA